MFARDASTLGRVFARVAEGLEAAAFVVFFAGTAVLAVIDARTLRLPNRVLFPVAWTGLALLGASAACSGSWPRLRVALASAAVLVAVFFALRKASGLGLGDVRLAGLLGLFLGWVGPGAVVAGLVAGTVAGGVFAAVLMVLGTGRRRLLPYGPFLVLGAWLAVLRAGG